METSIRFESAIKKLYEAFHNDTLNPEDCLQCAVGNILDKTDSWKHLTDRHGSIQLNYLGLLHQNLGRRFNGYTPLELLEIESSFLKGCGYLGLYKGRLIRPNNVQDKDVLFNGLSEVVNTLCKLDGSENIMDCSKLFNFEKQELLKLQN